MKRNIYHQYDRILKQKVLLLALAMLLPLFARGAETALVVELISGEKYSFKLLEMPLVTVPDENLIIDSKTTYVAILRKNVSRFYFAVEKTAIGTTKEDDFHITQMTKDCLTISGISEKDRVIVCDLTGRLYQDSAIRNGANVVIDLSNCPKGVYIIKIGNKQTIKIGKK